MTVVVRGHDDDAGDGSYNGYKNSKGCYSRVVTVDLMVVISIRFFKMWLLFLGYP